MSRLPVVSGKEVVRALAKIGFKVVSQKGSHIKMRRILENSKQTVIVPDHKEIKKGTLANGILRPINLPVEEFNKLL